MIYCLSLSKHCHAGDSLTEGRATVKAKLVHHGQQYRYDDQYDRHSFQRPTQQEDQGHDHEQDQLG